MHWLRRARPHRRRRTRAPGGRSRPRDRSEPTPPPAPNAALFPDLIVPRTASYNEADVSDKPAVIAERPLLNARQMAAGDELYRMRIQSMQAVVAPSFVDGRSFAGYLTGDVDKIAQASPWRRGFLIEQYPFADERGTATPLVNGDRGGLLEPPDDVDEGPFDRAWPGAAQFAAASAGADDAPRATYIALRTDRYTYVEYESGERELYDNVVDPYQLANIIATGDPLLIESLSTFALALHACAAFGCRSLETTVGMVMDGPTPTATRVATPTPAPTAARVWLPIAVSGD